MVCLHLVLWVGCFALLLWVLLVVWVVLATLILLCYAVSGVLYCVCYSLGFIISGWLLFCLLLLGIAKFGLVVGCGGIRGCGVVWVFGYFGW